MATPHDAETGSARDPLGVGLEIGLIALLVLAPLPFGSVRPPGRPGFELVALALGVVWVLRGLVRGNALPSRGLLAGVGIWLTLACVQLIPLGDAAVRRVSPHADTLRSATIPRGAALAAETRLLGIEPKSLDPPATISLAPGDTASALRTGAACLLVLLVATTVAAERGLRRPAAALLASAAAQSLYGLLVVASGHDQIWHVAKTSYLDSATGTFVNRNHFAGHVAMCTAAGLGWITAMAAERARRAPDREPAENALGRLALGTLLAALALAGLLTSMSRTGIALGLAAAGWILWRGLPQRGARSKVWVTALLIVAAMVPLARLGPERLVSRYAAATADLVAPGGRATVWTDSLEMAAAFPLTGVGFGAFGRVYPSFRSPEVRLYYAHAHSDLIQLAAEGGAPAAIGLLVVALALRRRLLGALGGRPGRLAVGFAAGLSVFALHALIDFNAHIPANLALAAAFAGIVDGAAGDRR